MNGKNAGKVFVTCIVAVVLGATAPMKPTHPEAAPPVFRSVNYGLTFRSPPRSTYCPIRSDWEGSDHGTILFLQPPAECGGSGYPSSNRGFSPDVPRIEVYYGYATGGPPPPCTSIGKTSLLGRRLDLCQSLSDGMKLVTLQSFYRDGSSTVEVDLTLVTGSEQLQRDLQTIVTLARTVRPCSYVDTGGAKPFVIGSGPRCPRDAEFF
jgi:hypothetical protein